MFHKIFMKDFSHFFAGRLHIGQKNERLFAGEIKTSFCRKNVERIMDTRVDVGVLHTTIQPTTLPAAPSGHMPHPRANTDMVEISVFIV